MNLPFPSELSAFAVWLGQAVAGGVVLSLLLERIPQFAAWHGKGKGLVVAALFVLLPFAGQGLSIALSKLDPSTVALVNDFLNKALIGLAAWGASQYAHDADPAAA